MDKLVQTSVLSFPCTYINIIYETSLRLRNKLAMSNLLMLGTCLVQDIGLSFLINWYGYISQLDGLKAHSKACLQ